MKRIEIRADGSKRVYTVNEEPSKTDQSFKKETDANTILRKYAKTGILTHVNAVQGKYADVSDIPDLHEALMSVKRAEKSFYQLPAEVRKRFSNQPALLVEFLQDPANNEEAVKLGLKVSPKPADNKGEPVKKDPPLKSEDVNGNSTQDSKGSS